MVIRSMSVCWMLAKNVILSVMQDLEVNHTVVNIATFYNIMDKYKNVFTFLPHRDWILSLLFSRAPLSFSDISPNKSVMYLIPQDLFCRFASQKIQASTGSKENILRITTSWANKTASISQELTGCRRAWEALYSDLMSHLALFFF